MNKIKRKHKNLKCSHHRSHTRFSFCNTSLQPRVFNSHTLLPASHYDPVALLKVYEIYENYEMASHMVIKIHECLSDHVSLNQWFCPGSGDTLPCMFSSYSTTHLINKILNDGLSHCSRKCWSCSQLKFLRFSCSREPQLQRFRLPWHGRLGTSTDIKKDCWFWCFHGITTRAIFILPQKKEHTSSCSHGVG